MNDICQQLNQRPLHECGLMFVGNGLTEDNDDSARQYLMEHGLEEYRALCLNIIEKMAMCILGLDLLNV